MPLYSLRLFLFVLLLFSLQSFADKPSDDYFIPDYLKFDNVTYKSNIKTVQLFPESAELALPLIEMNSGQRLQLSFDDLDADRKTYSYTLIHCDANWNPTNLIYTEYLNGYHDENITDYGFSVNTMQRYVHYDLFFPTEGIQLKKSGNYIVKVFEDYDEKNIVLTRRFMVLGKEVEVSGTAMPATIINDRYTKQEIDFIISNPDFEMNDPFQSLKVSILQNQRFDNCINNLKPTFTKPGQLVYDYDEGNVFKAGNEYRFFQDRNFRSANEKVAKYNFDDNKQNNIYLLPDDVRSYKRYSNQNDINGNFLIKTLDGINSPTDADYAFIHFYMPCDEPIANSEVYVFGAMSNWKLMPDFKMTYDTLNKAYIASPYLKQGYYNYSYAVKNNLSDKVDESFFESSHFETENDYYILVYYRAFGTFYDQLVGFKRLNSIRR